MISDIRPRTSADVQGRLPADEVVNTITHGIGVPLSLAGAVLLLNAAANVGDAWKIMGCAVYVATLVGVFSASTLSHCFVCPKSRDFFRSLDQSLIYLLIAGRYTPFSIAYLHGPLWNCQLALMWAIAITGFISKLFFAHRVNSCRVWSYIVLAWLSVIPAIAMIGSVPWALHGWVFLGAAAFMLGMLFYLLDVRRYHFHAMWHILVIAGCACHFAAIYFYAVPVA